MAGQNCASPLGAGPKSHVLIVEDDPAVSKLIKTYLEGEGYDTSTAETAVQMRAAIEAKKVKRVVACSGRVYYDLLAHRREAKANDVAARTASVIRPRPA